MWLGFKGFDWVRVPCTCSFVHCIIYWRFSNNWCCLHSLPKWTIRHYHYFGKAYFIKSYGLVDMVAFNIRQTKIRLDNGLDILFPDCPKIVKQIITCNKFFVMFRVIDEMLERSQNSAIIYPSESISSARLANLYDAGKLQVYSSRHDSVSNNITNLYRVHIRTSLEKLTLCKWALLMLSVVSEYFKIWPRLSARIRSRIFERLKKLFW